MASPSDIMNGMGIIMRYVEGRGFHNDIFQAGHDQIWCSEYNGDQMHDYELKMMEKMGWFEDEESWSHFT